MTSKLYHLDLPADRLEGEVVAAFFFEDERPLRGPAALLDWRLNGRLTELLAQGRASGASGEHVLVANNGKLGSGAALFCGAGKGRELEADAYFGFIRHLLETCRKSGFCRFALCLTPPPTIEQGELIQWMAEILEEMAGEEVECLLSFMEVGTARWLR